MTFCRLLQRLAGYGLIGQDAEEGGELVAWLYRHRRLVLTLLAIFLLLFTIGLTRGQRATATWPERLFGDLLSPVQGSVARATAALEAVWRGLADISRLRAENQSLKKENEALVALQGQLAEIKAENERLRRLVSFATSSGYRTIAARVIGRDVDSWFNQVVVDRGARDGLAPNLVVVTDQGIVGRVLRVTSRTATVLLLTDPESGVGAMVQRSRDTGVVTGVAGSSNLLLKFFSREADVAPGDVIISSGLNSSFPKGMVIGEVVKVGRSDYGLVKFAEVKPAVNFDRLEEVLILFPGGGS